MLSTLSRVNSCQPHLTLANCCLFLIAIAGSSQVLADEGTGDTRIQLAKPSAKQLAFADWEVGGFIHFGLNPFTGQEHGDGQEPPTKFNPTNLDTDQWIETAKAMGAKYVVLTARHEGGFCLWPSSTTEYTIANSPYQDGKGDIVREFVDSCRRHNLKVGLYHTAGFNAHEALKDYKGKIDTPLDWGESWGKTVSAAFKADRTLRQRFDQIQVEQFRELLTNYGPIDFMWSDHWNAADPNGVWRAITLLAEELQPDMVLMGPDTWVPGNETGHVVYPMWNAVNTVDGTRFTRPAPTEADTRPDNDYGLLETDVLTGHPLGKFWRVRECTTHLAFHYGGWFWHPDDVKKTYPRKGWEHLDLYYRTVGLGANTIINLPPDTTGQIPADMVAAAKALGDEIRTRFSSPVAQTSSLATGNTIEIEWDTPAEINTVVTMENIVNGQKVARYTLEAWVDGKYRPLKPQNKLIAWKPYESNPGFETIGHKKIDRVAPVVTNRVRFRCLQAIAEPVELRHFAVFNCPPLTRTFDASYPLLSGVDTVSDIAHGGMRRDVNYTGKPIVLGGKSYNHGLLICPTSTTHGHAEFDLSRLPKVRGMHAVIGIEDHTEDSGSVAFLVQVKQDSKWKTLYESPVLHGSDEPVEIDVEFPSGAKAVRLLTTNGGDNSNSDHAMWADARFTE